MIYWKAATLPRQAPIPPPKEVGGLESHARPHKVLLVCEPHLSRDSSRRIKLRIYGSPGSIQQARRLVIDTQAGSLK